MKFYPLITYKDNSDLNKKQVEWEAFYNFDRLHSAMNGKTLLRGEIRFQLYPDIKF